MRCHIYEGEVEALPIVNGADNAVLAYELLEGPVRATAGNIDAQVKASTAEAIRQQDVRLSLGKGWGYAECGEQQHHERNANETPHANGPDHGLLLVV